MTADQTKIQTILPEGPVFEMILVTADSSGTSNAAPVGIRRKAGNLTLELAADTTTAANLRGSGKGRLCLVRDPSVFARSAFNSLPDKAFIHDAPGAIPIVSGSAAAIDVCLQQLREYTRDDELGPSPFLHIVLVPHRLRILGLPSPPSRSYCAAIDAIVHTTRACIARDRGRKEALERYTSMARRAIDGARRTGTDFSTEEALGLCLDSLGETGKGAESRVQ